MKDKGFQGLHAGAFADRLKTREYNETFYDFTFPQPLKYKDKGNFSAAYKDQPSSIIPVDFEFYSTKDDIYFSIQPFKNC